MFSTADPISERKTFTPGTLGWTETDLDDPEFERLWFEGRYEIVNGVLTIMPPAYFSGSESLGNLSYIFQTYLRSIGRSGGLGAEADVVIDVDQIVRVDAAYFDADAKARQRAAALNKGKKDVNRRRIYVPPTLVVEAISVGHERHDRVTKRRCYAEFGIANFWILNVFGPTLECLILDGGDYRVDVTGYDEEEVRPAAFPGLVIPLKEVWAKE